MSERYFCRSCNLPLIIDDSLQNLSHAQQNLLTLDYAKKPSTITTSTQITNSSDKSDTPYNEYPKIPTERMALFKEATSMLAKGNVIDNGSSTNNGYKNLQMGRSRTNDTYLNNEPNLKPDEKLALELDGMRLNKTENNGLNSFVYLQDKATSSDLLASTFHTEVSDTLKSDYSTRDIKEDISKRSHISSKVDSLELIFNIISSKYEIDYPVCKDCAENLIGEMKQEYASLNKDKEVYLHFLKKLSSQNGPNLDKTKEALGELDKLQKQEEEVLKAIKQEDSLHDELNSELEQLQKEIGELELEEARLCGEQNKADMELLNSKDELDRAKNNYTQNMDLLDSLRKTNVFEKFFEINTNGRFATINELRLGSFDDTKVTWHEINAALGQLILLLSTCLNILDLDLDSYKLIPMGSTSKIEKYEKDKRTSKITKSVVQMYCTGDFSIGGFFAKNDLDVGMVALLDVVNQIGQHLKTLDKNFTFPYKMQDEKVAGYNIKPSSRSGWASWTSACKCLMINIKWVQTFCFAHYSNLS